LLVRRARRVGSFSKGSFGSKLAIRAEPGPFKFQLRSAGSLPWKALKLL
jgi:hypothetical protein